MDSNNFSIGIHSFKVLVQIHYSQSPGPRICPYLVYFSLIVPHFAPFILIYLYFDFILLSYHQKWAPIKPIAHGEAMLHQREPKALSREKRSFSLERISLERLSLLREILSRERDLQAISLLIACLLANIQLR